MAASEGVDLEWAIVDICRSLPTTQIKKKYSQRVISQAEKCSKHINSKLGTNKYDIWHSDEKVPGIGSIYAKPEPKTDIVIITRNTKKKYFTSVKMEGGIQLASGQGKSTAELFCAAAEQIPNLSTNSRKQLQKIIEGLNELPTRLLSESNLQRILKESDEKLIKEFINTRNNTILSNRSYEQWSENIKPQLLGSLLKFIQDDDKFYEALIMEALSGENTLKQFKGASANAIISPTGFYPIDSNYVRKIKPKIKMDIRAKSRGGITSIAFRIETRGSI